MTIKYNSKWRSKKTDTIYLAGQGYTNEGRQYYFLTKADRGLAGSLGLLSEDHIREHYVEEQ